MVKVRSKKSFFKGNIYFFFTGVVTGGYFGIFLYKEAYLEKASAALFRENLTMCTVYYIYNDP